MRNFSIISETLKGAVEDAGDELREMVSDVRESTLLGLYLGQKRHARNIQKSTLQKDDSVGMCEIIT